MENAKVKAYGKPGPDMPLETAKGGYSKKKAKKVEASEEIVADMEARVKEGDRLYRGNMYYSTVYNVSPNWIALKKDGAGATSRTMHLPGDIYEDLSAGTMTLKRPTATGEVEIAWPSDLDASKKVEADYKGDEEHVALVKKINELEQAEVKHAMGDTQNPKKLAQNIKKVEEKAPVAASQNVEAAGAECSKCGGEMSEGVCKKCGYRAMEAAQKVEADFMKKFIYGPMDGAEVETQNGTFFLPNSVYGEADPTPELVEDYVDGEIISVEKIHGYFGRFSAPGYTDATDWVFGETEEAVNEYLERMYGLDVDGAKKKTAKEKFRSDVSKKISKLAKEKKFQGPAKEKQRVAIALKTAREKARKRGEKVPPAPAGVEASQEVAADDAAQHLKEADRHAGQAQTDFYDSSIAMGESRAETADKNDAQAALFKKKATKKLKDGKLELGWAEKHAGHAEKMLTQAASAETANTVEASQEVVAPAEAPVVEAAVEVEAAKTPQIEIVKDGKVIDTFPDAFGEDAEAVKAFFKKLYSIKEEGEDNPKADKKEEKAEDLEKKPKALPKVEEPKEEKAPEAEEMPMAASKVEAKMGTCPGCGKEADLAPIAGVCGDCLDKRQKSGGEEKDSEAHPDLDGPLSEEELRGSSKVESSKENFVKVEASESDELAKVQAFFENRIKMVREIVANLVEKNHVVAEQNDIDQFLLQGKDLSTAVDEALKVSADRKFRELQSQSDAELLSLKASLPNLKMRTAKVDILASKEIEGGLDLMQLAILASMSNEGKTDAQFSIGAAFGGGLF